MCVRERESVCVRDRESEAGGQKMVKTACLSWSTIKGTSTANHSDWDPWIYKTYIISLHLLYNLSVKVSCWSETRQEVMSLNSFQIKLLVFRVIPYRCLILTRWMENSSIGISRECCLHMLHLVNKWQGFFRSDSGVELYGFLIHSLSEWHAFYFLFWENLLCPCPPILHLVLHIPKWASYLAHTKQPLDGSWEQTLLDSRLLKKCFLLWEQ